MKAARLPPVIVTDLIVSHPSISFEERQRTLNWFGELLERVQSAHAMESHTRYFSAVVGSCIGAAIDSACHGDEVTAAVMGFMGLGLVVLQVSTTPRGAP